MLLVYPANYGFLQGVFLLIGAMFQQLIQLELFSDKGKIISKLLFRVFNNYVKNNVEKEGVCFWPPVRMRLRTALHMAMCEHIKLQKFLGRFATPLRQIRMSAP